MRRDIQEAYLYEEKAAIEEDTKRVGDILLEKWSKKKNLGEGLIDLSSKNMKKARNTAIVLENQEKYLKKLTETQISSDFGTTPINVLRVIRLGYPNSVRGDLFHEFAMVTARDSIYYLKPIYTETARGATAGNTTYESPSDRYFSEIEEETVTGSINGSNKVFVGNSTGALTKAPLRAFFVRVFLNGAPVAADDGAGNMVGAALDPAQTNTVNYTTGAFTITFVTAPATGSTLTVQYSFDSEVPANYTNIKSLKLTLTDYNFRARPWPLYLSWNKMTELLLGTTLDIDAEEALIRGAGDELKKSLDFQAVKFAYGYAKGNTSVSFNADFAAAGADSAVNHVKSFGRVVEQAGKVIYNYLQRGGVNNMVVGTDLAAYLTLHDKFTTEGLQPKVGIYRAGTLNGIPVYQAPNDVIPANEFLGIWRNEQEQNDVACAFGSLVPLYQTQTLEFKEAYKETGLMYFGDQKALNPRYLVRGVVSGLDQY